jgi:3-oxoacyl-[acyl-carrier protein] reductase
MSRFTGQTAIVTGAARGIGLAIVERLGAEGAKVLLVDQDREALAAACARLGAAGLTVEPYAGDVCKPKDVGGAIDAAMGHWGRLDILVNNAGVAGRAAPIEEQTVEEMDRVYAINLRGVFLFCAKAIPQMRAQQYGRIVNIASIAGKEGNPNMVPYSATKAAVIALTKSIGKELAESGVVANAITPAVIETSILDQLTRQQVDYMVERIPMKRTGKPEEVAGLAAFLASRDCSFSTGAVFDISGGRATY